MKQPSADLRVRLPNSILVRLDSHAVSRGMSVRDLLIVLLDKELPQIEGYRGYPFRKLGGDNDGVLVGMDADGFALDN